MPEKPNKKNLTELIKNVPETPFEIVSDESEKQKTSENKESAKDNKDEKLRIEYYDKAREIITKTGDTTFSNLQRKLKIPINKAKRLLEIFEQDGILGPSIKGTPREILKKEVQGKEDNPEKSEPTEKENQPIDIFEEAKIRLNDSINKRIDAEIEKNRKEGEEEETSKEKNINTTTETKELSEEEKEILAVETEYNLKIKEKQDELNELLKEEEAESKPVEGDKESEKNKEKQEYLNKLEDAIKEGDKEKIKQIENEIYEKFVKETEQKPDTTQDNPEQPKLTQDQVFEIGKLEEFCLNAKAEFKNKLENGPLSSRLKNGVINGIDKWENYGKNEKGLKGFRKRFTKMAINMALIGAISSVSVEKLAEVGVGTASALGGSATTYLGKKMAIGLGIGSLMEIGGNKIPDKVKKWMPLIMGVGSVTASVILTAGIAAPVIVGLSSAAGYASSKLIKGNFTNEIIDKKEEEAKQKFFEKIKNESGPVDSNRLAEIKAEYIKILKKSESRKLWGKLIDGAKKLSIGSLVSSVTMEASGFAHDLTHNQTTQEVAKNTEGANEVRAEKVETQENNTQNTEGVGHEVETKDAAEIKHETETPTQPETKNEGGTNASEVKSGDDTQTQPEASTSNESGNIQEFMKTSSTQDAIKLGMYNPGDANESLTVQSGTMSFDDGNGHHVEVPYSSNGAIQTIADLKAKILAEYGDISKVPSGNISTHFTDMQGVEHDQSLIQTEGDGSVIVKKYEGNMFDSDHSGHKVESSSDTEATGNNKIPEQINPETGLPMNENGVDTQAPNEYAVPKQINPETGLPMNDSENNHHGTGEDTKPTNSNESSGNLSPERLEQVHKVFNDNIEHLFKERPTSAWTYVKDHVSATRIMEMYKEGEIKEDFKPLTHYMNELQNITGLRPQGVDILHPEPETIPHYIGRALEKAASDPNIGLDKVTL